jgi:prolyl 4-hydroxylase
MIDFKVVDNLLSVEKCQSLIALSEKLGFKEADIAYSSGSRFNKEYRNNLRCNFKDEDLRLELEQLIRPHVPDSVLTFQTGGLSRFAQFVQLSGNFRFYKYLPGQDFKRHRDGNTQEENGVSLVTVLFYLNDVSQECGGATTIYDVNKVVEVVQPKEGRMLWFAHSVAHAGERQIDGVKYVLRSDVVYL